MDWILTSGGISLMRDWLIGLPVNPPTYIAVSSGVLPSPPSPGSFWHKLPAEPFRTNIVYADADGQTAIFHSYLGLTDNPGQTVCYVGLYGGNPSLIKDSGTLFAVGAEPTPYSKTSLNTVSYDTVITLSGTVS